MEFRFRVGEYKIIAVAPSHDGEKVFMDLDSGETFTLLGTCTLPQVGDVVKVTNDESGHQVVIEPAEDPGVRVKDMMEAWRVLGYARLRRLTYELRGFSSLYDNEQQAIFLGLPSSMAVGMFIEQCKFKNAYKHEQKYVRAIREVAKELHLLD